MAEARKGSKYEDIKISHPHIFISMAVNTMGA